MKKVKSNNAVALVVATATATPDDSISALPDCIIHQIFSFLDTKLLVQSSILSNRWRYLWKTTPFLNFNLDFFPKPKKINRNRFIDFVDRVLHLRETCNIHMFKLYCEEKLEPGRLSTWVAVALRWNVQELWVDSFAISSFDLPHNLFTSDVKIIKLRLDVFRAILPSSSICSNGIIRSLELSMFKLPENSCGKFTFSFPVLKYFSIYCCTNRSLNEFTISAPLLEKLEILFGVSDTYESPIKINISTPKLKSFSYRGLMYGDYFFENLPALVNADIYIDQNARLNTDLVDGYVTRLLTAIDNVKKLTIPYWLVKSIVDSPSMRETHPNLFHKLRWMKIWTTIPFMGTITSFIERFPHLETLGLSTRQGMRLQATDEGDNRINSTLKTIEIIPTEGNEDEVKLLENFLKMFIGLKQLIIMPSESLAHDKSKMVTFREKVLNFPRASSSARISFH
ncbi:hypothetical protein AQUCO_00100724v1 [Aquilegia coerulea]|uniref:F-box domain-containing protein n=1 Tax=Aquilegia coerulea TaxID=218851 RepID=A0A2G5FBN6_AQUCA|nr:hypothetical protein AQUCO_00100724v1 [Aquilegia coerulea]